jgi:hypothetical protein
MDQEKGSPAAVQESPYHSTLIPGTSASWRLQRGNHIPYGFEHLAGQMTEGPWWNAWVEGWRVRLSNAHQSLPEALTRLGAAIEPAVTAMAAKIIQFMVLERALKAGEINTGA